MGNSVVVGSSVAGGGRDQKKGNIDKWEEKNKKDSNQICHCSQCPIKIMDDAPRQPQMKITQIILQEFFCRNIRMEPETANM